MRRLPVFFLIDSSSAMKNHLPDLNNGMKIIIDELSSDPYSLETVCISIIAFADKACVLSELTEVYAFKTCDIPVLKGFSDYGVGLNALMDEISRKVIKSSNAQKGDWRPIIFLFTAGNPSGTAYKQTFEKWVSNYRKSTSLFVFSLSGDVDRSIVAPIADQMFELKSIDSNTIRSLFKWISSSIQMNSVAAADSPNVPIKQQMTNTEIDGLLEINTSNYQWNNNDGTLGNRGRNSPNSNSGKRESQPKPPARDNAQNSNNGKNESQPKPPSNNQDGSQPKPPAKDNAQNSNNGQSEQWSGPTTGFTAVFSSGKYIAGIDFPEGYTRLKVLAIDSNSWFASSGVGYSFYSRSGRYIDGGWFKDRITLNLKRGQRLDVGYGSDKIELSHIEVDWKSD